MNSALRLFINYSLFIVQMASFIVRNVTKPLKTSQLRYSNSTSNTLQMAL